MLQEILKEEPLFEGKESQLGLLGMYHNPATASDFLPKRLDGDNYDDILHLLREDETHSTSNESNSDENLSQQDIDTIEQPGVDYVIADSETLSGKAYESDLEFMQDYFNLCDCYRQICSITFAYNMHTSKEMNGHDDADEMYNYNRHGRLVNKDKQQQGLDYKAKMIKANEKHKNILTRINNRMEVGGLCHTTAIIHSLSLTHSLPHSLPHLLSH